MTTSSFTLFANVVIVGFVGVGLAGHGTAETAQTSDASGDLELKEVRLPAILEHDREYRTGATLMITVTESASGSPIPRTKFSTASVNPYASLHPTTPGAASKLPPTNRLGNQAKTTANIVAS